MPVLGFEPNQKYQIVASFNGAEGLDANVDSIDMRPAKNLDRLEQKFMRQTLDYRKAVFWTDQNGTLHTAQDAKVPKLKIGNFSGDFYGFVVTVRSISQTYDEALRFKPVGLTLLVDKDSVGPIPRQSLVRTIGMTLGVLVGFFYVMFTLFPAQEFILLETFRV